MCWWRAEPLPHTLVCNYRVRGGQHQEQRSGPTPCDTISLLLRFPFQTLARALRAAPRRPQSSPPAGQQPPHRLPAPRRLFPGSYPRPAPCQPPPLLLLFRRVYPEVRQRGGVGSPSGSGEIEFFKALPASPRPGTDLGGGPRPATAEKHRARPHRQQQPGKGAKKKQQCGGKGEGGTDPKPFWPSAGSAVPAAARNLQLTRR